MVATRAHSEGILALDALAWPRPNCFSWFTINKISESLRRIREFIFGPTRNLSGGRGESLSIEIFKSAEAGEDHDG
jgi:hypothetical protein